MWIGSPIFAQNSSHGNEKKEKRFVLDPVSDFGTGIGCSYLYTLAMAYTYSSFRDHVFRIGDGHHLRSLITYNSKDPCRRRGFLYRGFMDLMGLRCEGAYDHKLIVEEESRIARISLMAWIADHELHGPVRRSRSVGA